MDLADLRNSLSAHGFDSTTTSEQDEFINAAYREIHRARRWPFLEAIDSTQSTVAGTASYTPPMTNWRNLDAVRIQDAVNTDDYIQIEWMESQQLFDHLNLDNYETATPRYWTMYASQIWFYPIPDQPYTVHYYYIQEPTDLVNDTDVPVVPVAYHDLLVSGALVRMCYRQRDWIGMELFQAKYAKDMQDLEEEYLIRQRQTSSHVKRSGYWNTEINYPLTATGF